MHPPTQSSDASAAAMRSRITTSQSDLAPAATGVDRDSLAMGRRDQAFVSLRGESPDSEAGDQDRRAGQRQDPDWKAGEGQLALRGALGWHPACAGLRCLLR
jgi:hypothetical protein